MKGNLFKLIATTFVIVLLTACSINLGSPNSGPLTRISGSGKVVTESRNVSGYSGITVNGVGNVVIDQTGTESLTITTDDNLLPFLVTEVRDGKLVIETKPNVALDRFKDMTFKVSVKDLKSLDLNGAANVDGKNLAGEQLSVSLNGTGAVTLAGQVTELQVSVSGLGGYNGENLASKRATVSNNGTGGAVVRVSDTLNASINGVGVIEYIGNPQVTKNVNGLGLVRQR